MDIAAFCRQSRVLVVAGKGGVGKTTITAALARMAARAGLDVLVVDLEGKPGVAAAFGYAGSLGYGESQLADGVEPGSVRARRITPDDALLEYLADHGMGRISKRLVSSGALDVVSTAIPGIRDILVLGKIKQLERESGADLILVDAPATGHAMTFLSSAQGLLDAARSGPVRAQAADVVELLTDPGRCQVALVTLPEEMPVNEVVEAAYQLEDKVGLTLGPVIVNACLPDEPWLAVDPSGGGGRGRGGPHRRAGGGPGGGGRLPQQPLPAAAAAAAAAGRGPAPAPAPGPLRLQRHHRAGRDRHHRRGPGHRRSRPTGTSREHPGRHGRAGRPGRGTLDRRLLRLRGGGQDHRRRPPSPWRAPGGAGGPAW